MNKEKRAGQRIEIRTDLAVEAREMLDSDETVEIEGVKVLISEDEDIKLTSVEILNKRGAEQMGKPVGTYITIESDAIKENMPDTHEKIIKILAENLGKLHNLGKKGIALIIGLGNWNVTPDALGPKVVSRILVTRHISESGMLPDSITDNFRPVAALSPGVMGLTGIETSEIVKGIVEKVKPDIVIAIDALAARRTNRINSTIQMCNTGVSPGAGVGNRRMKLDKNSLGVPVIAIGVPTVVDAATLVNDVMDRMLDSMIEEAPVGSDFYKMLSTLQYEEKYSLISDILNPYIGNMFVTPKEVDAVIERLACIISNAVNISLQPEIKPEDINKYMN